MSPISAIAPGSEATRSGAESGGPGTIVLALVEECRRAGLAVRVSSALAFGEALGVLGPAGLGDFYWAGRATLVQRPEDQPFYDLAYATLLAGSVGMPDAPPGPAPELSLVADEEPGPAATADDGVSDTQQVRFSRVETLRHADFATLDDDELAEARALVGRLGIRRAMRRSNRRRPVARGRGRLDLRRTASAAMRSYGEPIVRVPTERRVRPRRLVLLVDVSGSMERYARVLLRFAQVVATGARRVEVFAMGTQLTRLTAPLSDHDPDAALSAVADDVADWAGGTRLGETIQDFNDEWGVRGVARGATVVVLSDGWDRGDPGLLADEMQRLSRVAHRIVWVNPLKASDGYAPLAGGMAAALPHIDTFVSGHSLAALDDLVEVIAHEGAA